ncbi:MAG: hypothetical protein ACRECV_04100 [Xanthobacteraceae bacterium]
MSVGDGGHHQVQPKLSIWARFRNGIIRTEKEYAFLKGLALVSLIGTLIGAYFQNLSAYEAKVSALAKDDLTAATQAFTDASTALSVPLSLQERLIFGYFDAVDQGVDNDDNAYVTKNAHAIDGPYETAYTTLRESINLLAQKMEIDLDWPSNAQHDPTKNVAPTADPITTSDLGAYKFNCETNMPSFGPNNHLLALPDPQKKKPPLLINWYSAKHNVLTIYYCFNLTHNSIRVLREWASKIQPSTEERKTLLGRKKTLQTRLNNQVLRLYAFMGLAMNQIDLIRAKYRPNGYLCSVPGAREALGKTCAPIQIGN